MTNTIKISLILSVGLLVGCANNTVSFYAENDALAYGPPGDANYTNGLQLTLTPNEIYEPCANVDEFEFGDEPCKPKNTFHRVVNFLNVMHDVSPEARADAAKRPISLEYGVGQQIYTPDDISLSTIQPLDRPFGGWAFGFLKINNDYTIKGDADEIWEQDRRVSVTTQLGITGPSSKAGAFQKYFHETSWLCDCTYPNGWGLQIREEPAFVYAVEWEDRLFAKSFQTPIGRLRLDMLGSRGISVGNVYTGIDVGGTIRFGYNLPRSFSPRQIGNQRFLASIDENAPGPLRVYGFVGVTGRAVARDIFLDGGVFKTSPHTVKREPLQGEGQIGFGLEFRGWSLRVMYVHRSDQFETQEKSHRFGSFIISRAVGASP